MPRSLRLSASDRPQMPPPTIATFIMVRCPADHRLERLDLDFPELDRSGAVLEHDRSFVEHTVTKLCRRLPVEHDRYVATIRRDFIRVPFAAGLRHWTYFHVAGDSAGAVARVLSLIEYVGLVAGPVCNLFWIEATEINPAVCVVAWPEFDADDEVLEGFLADQISGLFSRHLVCNNRAIRNVPVGFADLVPLVEILAVEQNGPPGLLTHCLRYRIGNRKPQTDHEGCCMCHA